MSKPDVEKTRHVVCGHCGEGRDVVNGEWLKSLRQKTGKSLRATAKEIGCSPAFLSDVEKNHRLASDKIVLFYK